MNKQYILTLSCQDKIGIVAAVTSSLAEKGLFILELSQFSDPSTDQFFMRIFFEATQPIEESQIVKSLEKVAASFKMNWELHDKGYKPKVLLLVSKAGHCLNDLLHRFENETLPIEVSGVVSNHTLLEEMAARYQVPFYHVPVSPENKLKQEETLIDLIESEAIDLVVLARYMQIISPELCARLRGKIINIHHSFLPSFKGAKPYHQAYDRGVKVIGATAHYVTDDLDEGPIIDQETIRVRHDHTPKELVQLGCDVESLVLARAVKYHIEQRVLLNGHKTVVFNP